VDFLVFFTKACRIREPILLATASTRMVVVAKIAEYGWILSQWPERGIHERLAELFGETTRTGNKTWLIKRIACRLQALEEGDLSELASFTTSCRTE
jgi:hypothetical protein